LSSSFDEVRAELLHQRYKDIAFLVIAQATWPNYWLKRLRHANQTSNGHSLDLHLGCGIHYLPGFVNIDANPLQKTDMWLDVRCGLPFASGSVNSIYTTHMIEHLYPDELERLLGDCARVLKAGGGMRIIVPSLSNAITAFQQKRHDWFYDDFPRHFDSLGGRFSNFVFCDGQHRTAFDLSYLDEILRKAGFREVAESGEGRSQIYGAAVPVFEPGDAAGLPHSVYVEAFK
jgi:predicted SAM-dependent methyltransferase